MGTVHTRPEVLEVAGSRTRRSAVLRAAGGGPVVGLAVRLDRNPDAPARIAVGSGTRMAADADAAVGAAVAIPVWVGTGGRWTYTGRWLPTRHDPATGLLHLVASRDEARSDPQQTTM